MKKPKKAKRSLMLSNVFLASTFLFFATPVGASYLQMAGQLNGDQYSLKNNGDESSRQVHPFVQAGGWTHEFDAVDLAAGEEHIWTLPLAEIQKQMPRGRAPMPIMIRYQDTNGYPFSVPEVRLLETPGLSIDEQKTLADVPLRASMTVGPIRHNEFQVRYEMENLTAESLRVTPKIWIPEELRLMTVQIPLEIKPHGKLEGFFQIHNEKALAKSYYNLFATFEFKQKNLVNFIQLSGGVSITPESLAPPFHLQLNSRQWWMLLGGLFVLGWLALHRLVLRPLRGTKTRKRTPYLLRKR